MAVVTMIFAQVMHAVSDIYRKGIVLWRCQFFCEHHLHRRFVQRDVRYHSACAETSRSPLSDPARVAASESSGTG